MKILLTIFMTVIVVSPAASQSIAPNDDSSSGDGVIREATEPSVSEPIRLAFQDPSVSVQPVIPEPQPSSQPVISDGNDGRSELTSSGGGAGIGGAFDLALPQEPSLGSTTAEVAQALPVEQQGTLISNIGVASATEGLSSIVLGNQATVRGSTDAVDLFTNSYSNTNVQQRMLNPIINQPWIRGYRYGQIRTTGMGSTWFPARPDLDTPLSRIDSSLVREVQVIKGPYSVRNGPGFAFVDVSFFDTPRYDCGGWGGITSAAYDTNGDQWKGRQSFWGGDDVIGWRIGYTHRTGVDYEDGAGTLTPSGYNNRNLDVAFGADLTEFSSLEFKFLRNDLTDAEIPSQFNDLGFLVADAYALTFKSEEIGHFDLFKLDVWHNQTRFEGSLDNKDVVADRFTQINLPATLGDGQDSSSGARMSGTIGSSDYAQVTVGADFTSHQQVYAEIIPSVDNIPRFGVPKSRDDTFGLFADSQVLLTERLTMKSGARVDFAQIDVLGDTYFNIAFDPANKQSFTLGAAFLTLDYEISDRLTYSVGFGTSERAPTATDLYADMPYLGIVQPTALFFPLGNANLDKETVKQFDMSLSYYGDFVRGGVSGFYSEIDDFITWDFVLSGNTFNADATLAGVETYTELDLLSNVKAFGTLAYTEGDLDSIDRPLWGIPPLESILGMRLTGENSRWAIEYAARVVAGQDRTGVLEAIQPVIGTLNERSTAGFATHDIRTYYRLNEAITLIGGVENLGDRLYQEHLDTRQRLNRPANQVGVFRPGRNFYFAVESRY